MSRTTRLHLLALILLTLGDSAAAAPPAAKPPELVLQAPPAAAVNSVAVSPDGSLVATAANEGGVRLYDARTGVLLKNLGGAGVRSVAFSPDGRSLAAAGYHMDKLVGVYNAETCQRRQSLAGHTEVETFATVFSPDGKLLASSGADKQILVWELATGHLRHKITNQDFATSALAFSPDSALLAGGGGDRAVRLWDTASGRLVRTLAGHDDWVAAVAFSPDGKTLASGTCDWGFHRAHDWLRPSADPERCQWRLWEAASGKLLRSEDSTGRLLSLAFAPDGKSLACGIDKQALLFDLAKEGPGRALSGHAATVTSVAFSPDGKSIISGSHDQTVQRTSLATAQHQWQTAGYFEQVNAVALSQDASLLVTGASDHRFARARLLAGSPEIGPGAVRLWDARTGRMLRRVGEAADQIMAVALSPDGRLVAGGGGAAGGKGVVRVFEAASGQAVLANRELASAVLAVAFAPDSAWLAIGTADGLLQVYDTRSGIVVHTLAGHDGGATSLAWSPDGRSLICGQGHGGARIWDVESWKLLHACPPANPQARAFTTDRLLNSIGLSRDGKLLATCNSSVNNEFVEPVRIWDAGSGELTRDFTPENIHGRPMALSPDGTILATGGKSVQLWDVRTGQKLRQLTGHLKRTQSIVFSADGKLLVSGGSYGSTNIWEVASGKHLVTLFAFAESRNGAPVDDWVAYHPDGYYDSSPAGNRYLAWRVGDELQSPNTLGPQLRRPDRIEAALKQ